MATASCDDWQKFSLRKPLRQDDDFEFRTLLEQSNALRRNRVTNQNFHKGRRV